MTNEMKNIFTAANLEENLPTKIIGKTIIVYDETDSTNDLLKPIITDKKYDGLAVFARHQRKGKGTNGREWHDKPDASILCSVLINLPGKISDYASIISITSAISTAGAIAKTFDLQAKIKWPNDIYIAEKKLAGILIESSQTSATTAAFIIGVGINLNQTADDFPAEISNRATSIALAAGKKLTPKDHAKLARELLIQLDKNLQKIINCDSKKINQIKKDWLALAASPSQKITVTTNEKTFTATITDIDLKTHALLVKNQQNEIIPLKQNTCKIT